MSSADHHSERRLLLDLERFGDRTSSFMTLYPGFESFYSQALPQDGQVRFQPTRGAWVGATEPLAPLQLRATLFHQFAQEARQSGRRAHLTPVSEQLARELQLKGYEAVKIGAEPIFELSQYFLDGWDPLSLLPIARTLKKRGALIEERTHQTCDEILKEKLERITGEWQTTRGVQPFSFLNQVQPFFYSHLKKLFILTVHGEIQAFLTAVPLAGRSAYYFSEVIRSPHARSGSVELLMIEAMQRLHREGITEVRLGMCPLALSSGMLGFLFRYSYWGGYSFKSQFEFKSKLNPTRWDPLYAVTSSRSRLLLFMDLLRAHFPEGISRTLRNQCVSGLQSLQKKYFRTNECANAWSKPWPSSAVNGIKACLTSALFSVSFVLIHLARTLSSPVARFFETSAYTPGRVTWEGLFSGPFFHNNVYHLLGDQLSFIVFGGLLELRLHRMIFWTATALGLWASNPVTHLLVAGPLQLLAPEQYANFLVEQDYGSSNAIYAQVGALGATLANPSWILLPFLVNGILLCFLKQSFLSLHHVVALGLGYYATYVLMKVYKK